MSAARIRSITLGRNGPRSHDAGRVPSSVAGLESVALNGLVRDAVASRSVWRIHNRNYSRVDFALKPGNSKHLGHTPASVSAIHRQLGVPEDYSHRTGLPFQLAPKNLFGIGEDLFGREQYLCRPAADALLQMFRAAEEDGVVLQVVSAYRSVEYQVALIQRKLEAGQSIDTVLGVVAAPGYSEHQSGCAVDLTTPESEPVDEQFEKTAAFAWLQRRGGEFRFALSYPRGNPYGVIFEPWHWCYRADPD